MPMPMVLPSPRLPARVFVVCTYRRSSPMFCGRAHPRHALPRQARVQDYHRRANGDECLASRISYLASGIWHLASDAHTHVRSFVSRSATRPRVPARRHLPDALAGVQKVRAEPEALRRHLMALLLPFVVVPFRYASALCPPHHFVLPFPAAAASDARTQYTTTIPTTHGAYPIYATSPPPSAASSSTANNSADGHGYAAAPVLPAPPARLLFFARLGLARMGVPPHLPLTRADAVARYTAAALEGGELHPAIHRMPIGPTQADIVEKNARPAVRFPRGGDWGAGRGQGRGQGGEHDGWEVGRVGRVYELGSFTGLWAGTMVMPFELAFNALLSSPTGAFPPAGLAHDDLVAVRRPVYMRLAEHRAYSPNRPAPPPAAAASTLDAGWLPPGARVVGAEVRVRAPGAREEEAYAYEAVRADGGVRAGAHDPEVCAGCLGREARGRRERARARARAGGVGMDVDEDRASAGNADADADAWWDGWDPLAGACDGVLDVVFTGATDARHGMAWHHYEYTGRVRPWDGLIGILMKPRDASLGLATCFLSGHLVGRDTFEGTWQIVGQDVRAPSWGGSVCLARGEE
ncbi:hypothetical protein B0H10DRAFT_1948146 [Mycena sp. CBHHK59/15]|nr:hypothetical protein B0H10DRAFT_1948146 [Mycena sp. CBHHK59/15]